ncbi:MAG: pirin family protein [Patiriisocius sp.]|uniref:pirin family protein n=1 Tax=Patiriisocius sp. TaxID=2822396 RepID=UPI003EF84969
MESLLLKANERKVEKQISFTVYNFYNAIYFEKFKKNPFKKIGHLKHCFINPNMGILPHDHGNEELITIQLSGTLIQKTNDGETNELKPNQILWLNPVYGIKHFEYNQSSTNYLECISMGITAKKNDIKDKSKLITISNNKNVLETLITPNNAEKNSISIPQDFYMHYGNFNTSHTSTYTLKNNKNGCIIINQKGNLQVNQTQLNELDTFFIWDIEEFSLKAETDSNFLLFEL